MNQKKIFSNLSYFEFENGIYTTTDLYAKIRKIYILDYYPF